MMPIISQHHVRTDLDRCMRFARQLRSQDRAKGCCICKCTRNRNAKNDEAEFLSLHTIFDETNPDLSVSSTKAMVGHCLGAAGAIEAVFAIKALTENKIPPTIGYSEEDIEALGEKAGTFDFMPNTMKEKDLHYVMSNSFAFGGSNASIIFSKEPAM